MALSDKALDPSLGVGLRLDNESTDEMLELAGAARTAAQELLGGAGEDRADASIAYRTLSAIAAAGVRRDSEELIEAALTELMTLYRLGDYDVGLGLNTPAFEASLWESIWIEVAALGGMVVRRQAWGFLPAIVLQDPRPEKPYYVSWYRHGQVHSARSSTDPDDSILRVAATRLVDLEPTAQSGALAAVCQFDLLAAMLIAEVDDDRKFYPNAAAFGESEVEGLVIDHLRHEENALRQVIFPGETSDLRTQLKEYNEQAVIQASLQRYSGHAWAWRGFGDGRTWTFLSSGNLLEEWAPNAN